MAWRQKNIATVISKQNTCSKIDIECYNIKDLTTLQYMSIHTEEFFKGFGVKTCDWNSHKAFSLKSMKAFTLALAASLERPKKTHIPQQCPFSIEMNGKRLKSAWKALKNILWRSFWVTCTLKIAPQKRSAFYGQFRSSLVWNGSYVDRRSLYQAPKSLITHENLYSIHIMV